MPPPFTTETVQQQFSVPFAYPVHFTRDVLAPDNDALGSVLRALAGPSGTTRRALVYLDDGFLQKWPDTPERVTAYLAQLGDVVELACPPRAVPGGEVAKNGWEIVQGIIQDIGKHHICRQSCVIAIGGGSMLDMVGFAVSIAHRGVRLIRIPTSVLAQADGGVGVKNGMDEHGVKNYIGSFAPPAAVINDYDFLQTLPLRYWTGGVAEAFKVAMIKDAPFFDRLCSEATALGERDDAAMAAVVRQTAQLHLDHIRTSGDPFEFGSARPLDFGHWAAHKLEVLSNYVLSHGEAVAIGIALDTTYAVLAGMLPASDGERLFKAFEEIGLPSYTPLLRQCDADGTLTLLKGLEEFREHLGGELNVTLPDGLGRGIEVHAIDHARMIEAIGLLEARRADAA